METYFCFLLVCSSFFRASLCFFVSNSAGKWTEEKSGCKMATPVINYTTLELDVTINKTFQNSGIWVGYYEQMAMFDYIGCIKPENVMLNPVELGMLTPGRCFSACSYTKLIGLEKTNCYCFDAVPDGNIKEDDCTFSCDDNTACGGNGYISLYMKITDDKELVHSGGNYKCLRVYVAKDYKDYTWINCTLRLWSSCTSGSSVTVVDTSMTWNDAAKNCIHWKMVPTRYQSIRYMNVTKNYYPYYSWTGVVRSGVIYKEIELVNTTTNILYGFFTHDESLRYILNFSHTDVEKPALCEIYHKSSGTPTTPSDRSSAKATREQTTNASGFNSEVTNSQGIDAAVPAGISAAGLLVVIAVVIAIIVLKRRDTSKFCGEEQQATNTVYENSLNNYTNTDRNIGTVALVNLSTGLQNSDDDSYYEEPLSVQAMNRFHNYDAPPSNQQTTSRHYEKPNYEDTAGPYESLGQRNTSTYMYDTIHN